MKTADAIQISDDQDPIWIFFAEYSLSEFMVTIDQRNEPAAGTLFQIIRDLGVSLECIRRIKGTMTEVVKQMMVQFNQGKTEFSIVIRLFLRQKRITDAMNEFIASGHPRAGQTIAPAKMMPPADPKIYGGWGYFLILRARDSLADSQVSSHQDVDLYIYREGN